MTRGKGYYLLALINHLALVYWVFFDFSLSTLLIGMFIYYTLSKLGGDIGFHRHYCHGAFKTSNAWQYIMLSCGTLFGAGGSSIDWAAFHSYHHYHVDNRPKDYNFRNDGARIYYRLFNKPLKIIKHNAKHIARAMKDPKQVFFHQNYFYIVLIYLLMISVACYYVESINPFIGLFALPRILSYHLSAITDIVCHKWGYQSHETGGDSRNNVFLNLISLGTAMHNNHHSHPRKYDQGGSKWYEFDLYGKFIKNFMISTK